LGAASAIANPPIPVDLAGWISALPTKAGFFIKGIEDLIVVGISLVLFGRSIRLYFERDARILRNLVLIMSIAWSRWILDGTADILIRPGIGYDNLVYVVIVGILIATASVLVTFIIHRSAKDFFQKSKEKVDEFGES